MLIQHSCKSCQTRRGAVLVWMALSLAVIVGILAVALDGGRVVDERRYAQGAADAASLAAGESLYRNFSQDQGNDPDGSAKQAALAAAAARGYANDGANSVVTVNIPPQSGPFTGQAGHAEVVITTHIAPGFSAVLTHGQNVTVKARGVARGRSKKYGLVVLEPTSPSALKLSGSAVVTVVGASAQVNSSSAGAVQVSTKATLTAASVDVVGGLLGTLLSILFPVRTNQPPIPDPLRNLPVPNPLSYPVRSLTPLTVTGTKTLQPGVYTGGIVINGWSDITMSPGVFILQGGGLQINGSSTVRANQVVVYNTGGAAAGPITISPNTNLIWSPPSSGPYSGLCIFQDRLLTKTVSFAGGGNFNLTGTIYAAGAPVTVSAKSTTLKASACVCGSMSVGNRDTVTIDPGANPPARSPEHGLVE